MFQNIAITYTHKMSLLHAFAYRSNNAITCINRKVT